MNGGLWGLMAALAFGGADFCGRLSGRALGPRHAMLGLMVVGAVLLSLHGLATGGLPALTARQAALAVAAGITATLAPLLFYKSMTYGPLSLVGPICGAYPAFVVPVTVIMGARPSALEWAAMGVTMLGALVVAKSAGDDPDGRVAADRTNRRRAAVTAVAAGAMFAAALLVGREAVLEIGAAASLWLGRCIGVALLVVLILAARERPQVPRRWWRLLTLQGILDSAGYLAFYLGSRGEDAAAAAVASSGFMVVAVLLGRVILKEQVTPRCWLGVALVFGGVAVLSTGASS
ncbi:MAG: DMT family transporter [Magnetospirillum sp.]|nr:DMT family transporter [Magnetospirillum sp.]